ncbi:MAG: HD-GYP domain-containing protein [Actinomycetota bacterium]|nr:HD-GYP domain-containing protein [Actinomycetota bacterium]
MAKTRLKIILYSVLAGVLVWLTDEVIDYFIYYRQTMSFLDLIIFDIPRHELLMRIIIVASFIVYGIIVSNYVVHSKKMQDRAENLAKFPLENPSPILRVNNEGRILFCNPWGTQVLKKWETSVGGFVPQDWRGWINQAFAQQKYKSREISIKDKTYLLNMVPITDSEYANIYGADITGLKLAEAEKEKQLKLDLKQTIGTISDIVETRDAYTAGHQRRVSQLAEAIAIEMGLNKNQAESIAQASMLHDLGKISIPSSILNKPGRLSDIEMSLIKSHPEEADHILKKNKSMDYYRKIILQHHERMDGSGYPHKLQGEQIMMEARIMAVADVVEAMTSHRPYRAALDLDQALEEIRANRSTLYDGRVVDACVRVIEEGKFKF